MTGSGCLDYANVVFVETGIYHIRERIQAHSSTRMKYLSDIKVHILLPVALFWT